MTDKNPKEEKIAIPLMKRLSFKIICVVLIFCIALMIGVTFLVYYPMNDVVLNRELQIQKNHLGEMESAITAFLEETDALSQMLYYNNESYEALLEQSRNILPDVDEKSESRQVLLDTVFSMRNFDVKIYRIVLRVGSITYTSKQDIQWSLFEDTRLSSGHQVCRELRKANGKNVIMIRSADDDINAEHYTVQMGRILKNLDTGNEIGAILFDINLASFFTQYLNDGKTLAIAMLTEDGRIVEQVGQVDPQLLQAALTGGAVSQLSYEKERYCAVKQPLSGTDDYLVSICREADLMDYYTTLRQRTMLIITGLFFVAVLLVILYAKRLGKRFRNIQEGIDQYKSGNLNFRIVDRSSDELAAIASNFNEMGVDIRNQIEKNKLLQQKHQEIEKEILWQQINPHFIYNSLESIQMYAVLRGEKGISRMVGVLGRLLRIGLGEMDEIVSVETEFEFIEMYLKMQQMRYEDHLQFHIHISPEVREKKILKFILQPLVENSIRHGLEEKIEPGFISVSATWENQRIVLVVEDNGIGIPEEKLKSLQEKLYVRPNTQRGIGMKNIRDRIELFYNGEGTFDITSTEGVGTRICITLPPIEKGQEDRNGLETES